MKKAGNVEAKANLQPPFYVRGINSKCLKDHCPLEKKDKEDTYWKSHDKASKYKNKAKSYTLTFTNQPQTKAPKKNKHGCWGGHPATGVNATKVAMKEKDKVPKNLSHYHQKVYYASKSPDKPKNYWQS